MGTKKPDDESPATSPQLNLNTLLCSVICAVTLWIGSSTWQTTRDLAVAINSLRTIDTRLNEIATDTKANIAELRIRVTAIEVEMARQQQVRQK